MSEFVSYNNKSDKINNPKSISDEFIGLKRQAYLNLDQALAYDSSNIQSTSKTDNAIIMYEKCLNLIDQALSYYENNRSILIQFDDSLKTYNQLISMKNQTFERLNFLKSERIQTTNKISNDKLNEYEFLKIGDDILDSDDLIIIDESSIESNSPKQSKLIDEKFTKATEILCLENGVQLFYIANDGTVSTPSYPTTLSLYSFDDNKNVSGFIRVGSWMYPLVPNQSPGMKTNFNAYIFPNDDEENKNQNMNKFSFVGITFSERVKEEEKKFFEDILSNYNSLIYQNTDNPTDIKRPIVTPNSSATISGSSLTPPSNSTTKSNETKEKDSIKESILTNDPNTGVQRTWSAEGIAQKIINGAQYLSQGVATTTDYANKYIKVGGEKIKTNIQPNSEPVNVDPKLKNIVQNVRYGTHVSVRVSDFILNKLTSIASSTAKTVAPHLKQGSVALLSKSGISGGKNNANNYVENVCTLAHGSIHGFGLVYDSLENAAKTLAKNFAEETVTVVDHKYGNDAAKLTENGLYSVGNVALTVNNLRDLKIIRKFAKATAKETISSSSSKSNLKINQSNEMDQNSNLKK